MDGVKVGGGKEEGGGGEKEEYRSKGRGGGRREEGERGGRKEKEVGGDNIRHHCIIRYFHTHICSPSVYPVGSLIPYCRGG